MNKLEKQIKEQLESEGWKVLRGGAPDFIAIRVNNGQIIDYKGVEVKSKNGKLTYEQAIYKQIFKMAGIYYQVIIPPQTIPDLTAPDHFNPVQTKPFHPRLRQAQPAQPTPFLASPVRAIPFLTTPAHPRPNQPNPIQTRPNSRK